MLVMKDPQKGTEVSNYQPIACLPMMPKLMAGIMPEKIYVHLAQNGLQVDEQEDAERHPRALKMSY